MSNHTKIIIFMSALLNFTMQAYRIVVHNARDTPIWAAVYRENNHRPQLTRTSVARYLPVGSSVWFGGVLENTKNIKFALYGAPEGEILTPSFTRKPSVLEPEYLLDIGTGELFFVLEGTMHNHCPIHSKISD